MIPSSHGVRAVADIGGRIGRPGFVGHNILTNGEVGREGEQLIPVSNCIRQSHLEGLVVQSNDIQLRIGVDVVACVVGRPNIRIAVHDFEHVAVVRSQRGGSSALPGKGEVTGGNRLAVRPSHAIAQGVGVGHSAVLVGHAFRQLSGCICNDLEVAVFVLCPLGQAAEQVRRQGRAVHGGVERRINGIRFGSQADIDDTGFRIICGSVSRFGRRFRAFSGSIRGRCAFGRRAAARCQREHHSKSQHKSKDLLHGKLILSFFILNMLIAYSDQLISFTLWQATKWPEETSLNSGILSAHCSPA